jgi:hypothetical protein
MAMTKAYQAQLRSLLSPKEHTVFKKLNTPKAIQNYLDRFPINFELAGETIYSPRRSLRNCKAHCVEGALLAAASLAYHGKPALLMDIQTAAYDDDHVVALFKQNGCWGAISKTNHTILRWRDPVYTTVRELAMSYFHEYIINDGRKTMRAFSKPFDLTAYAPTWVTEEDDLVDLVVALDDSPHTPVASPHALRTLRPAQRIETRILAITEWLPNGKKKKH